MHELLYGAGTAPQGGEDRGALWLLVCSFAADYRFMQASRYTISGQVRFDASSVNPDAHAIKALVNCHRRCLSKRAYILYIYIHNNNNLKYV